MKEEILKLYSEGKTRLEISKILDCSIGTVYWHTSIGTRKAVVKNRNDRRKEIKQLVKREIFGGKCCLCQYNKCLSGLDFHHLQADDKENLISILLNEGYILKLETELPKVIMVCRNCHAEIHEGLISNLPKSPYTGQNLRKANRNL